MDTQTLKRLEEAGFVATSVAEFLGLSPAEEALVETKVRFTALLKQTRRAQKWTQAQLAKALETTQQTVARAERGGESVSLDFLLRSLVTLGLSLTDIGEELRALDAVLHPETADCAEESPCSLTEPMSSSEGQVVSSEKDGLIPGAQVVAAAQPSAPMLRLIRGGFSGNSANSSRQWPTSARESDGRPLAATG